MENIKYTIYIERDQFPDPEKYPDGIAWRSGVINELGEEIDGGGDLPTYEEARELVMATLGRLLNF